MTCKTVHDTSGPPPLRRVWIKNVRQSTIIQDGGGVVVCEDTHPLAIIIAEKLDRIQTLAFQNATTGAPHADTPAKAQQLQLNGFVGIYRLTYPIV